MRKNESWADSELCNICLSLKNHLLMKQEHQDAECIPSVGEMWKMTKSFTQRCDTDRVKVLQLPHHLLRNSQAFPPVSLSQAASLHPTWIRLMVFWSQAANFSLSRNNPLHWQMSGIWHDVHLWFRLCCTWEVPASEHPLGKLLDFGQFLLSQQKIKTVGFIRPWICGLPTECERLCIKGMEIC